VIYGFRERGIDRRLVMTMLFAQTAVVSRLSLERGQWPRDGASAPCSLIRATDADVWRDTDQHAASTSFGADAWWLLVRERGQYLN